jgi:hypothetical protein
MNFIAIDATLIEWLIGTASACIAAAICQDIFSPAADVI